MGKLRRLVLLALTLTLFPFCSLAHAEVLPKGVTEIDLGPVLGGGEYYYYSTWMHSPDVLALYRSSQESDESRELVLLDIRDCTILSQARIPHETWYISERIWDNGVCYLLLKLGENEYMETSIAPDGTVETKATEQRRPMSMPGGQTAIREAENGSLYAIDLATGEETLLLQGTIGYPGGLSSYEDVLNYVPAPGQFGPWTDDPEDEPVFQFPPDEESMYDYLHYLYHGFSVAQALDEHRFVYTAYGWERPEGFGVYDLLTGTNHRLTSSGYHVGIRGNTLYGSYESADARTYETTPLPEEVQRQLGDIEDNSLDVDCDISPDGRLLAHMDMGSYDDEDLSSICITDLQTGDILKTYDIANPYAHGESIVFLDNTHLLLFFEPLYEPLYGSEAEGSPYLYLINLEE